MSSLYRIIPCATSVRYAQRCRPRPSSEAALRGTLLHEWQNYYILNDLIGQPGKLMPPGEDITEEERSAIFMILDYIRKIMDDHPDIQIITEQYVAFPQNVIPQEDCGGTTDITLYSQSLGRAWVLDSKFGRVFVEVEGNYQGLGYAVSGLWHVPVKWVTIIIAQPFSPDWEGKTIREWSFSSDYLVEFQDVVEQALIRAEDPEAKPTAGAWCLYCAAELVCPARRLMFEPVVGEAGVNVISQDGEVLFTEEKYVEASDQYLLRLWQIDKAMRQHLDAGKRELMARMRRGMTFPGLMLGEAQAKSAFKVDKRSERDVRRLADKIASIILQNTSSLGERLDPSDYDTLADSFVVITAPNIGDTRESVRAKVRERLLAQGKTEKEIAPVLTHADRQVQMLTQKLPTGDPVIVPMDGKREKWDPVAKARAAFAGVKLLPAPPR